MTEKSFYRVREAAELLDVCEESIRAWLKTGRLKGKKFGRIWRISKESVHEILPDHKK